MQVRQLTNGGSAFVPVGSVAQASSLPIDLTNCHVYIKFTDANGIYVTPSAGTVKVEGSPDGEQWIQLQDSPVNAPDCALTATYSPPRGEGYVAHVRVTCTGITGATHYYATAYKF